MSRLEFIWQLVRELPCRTRRVLTFLMAVAVVAAFASTVNAQGMPFTTDFETGNLSGWQQRGDAFRSQPTLGDNPTARGRGQPSNHQGKWWIGTFEKYQGRRGERAGSTQGDQPQGWLQSAQFTLPAGSLTFLVGGGAAFETRVELIVLNEGGDVEFNENRVYHASGNNSETMRPVTWDLDRYAGRSGFIRIVDDSSGPWGHINADYFRFQPRFQVAVPADRRPVAPGSFEVAEPAPVVVPDLRGRNLQQARDLVKESGLQIEDVQTVEAGYTEGQVIRQVPEPGTQLPRGGGLILVLGPRPKVRVPNVIGLDAREATQILRRARLRTGKLVEQVSPQHRPGTVIEQNPSPGTEVAPGQVFNLVTAAVTRVPPVEVPDLLGRNRFEAGQILEEAGLFLAEVSEREAAREPGTVLEQRPRPGRMVEAPSGVSILVAVQPPPPAVEESPTEGETPGDGERPLIEDPPLQTSGKPIANTVWIATAAAALVLGAGIAHLIHRRIERRRDRSASSGEGELSFEPRPDPGMATMLEGKSTVPESELRLRPVRDAGEQHIEPPGDLTESGKSQP